MVEELTKMIAGLIRIWQNKDLRIKNAAKEADTFAKEPPATAAAPQQREKEKNSSVACLTGQVNAFLLAN